MKSNGPDRDDSSTSRRRALVLLRLTTFIATACLLLSEVGLDGIAPLSAMLILTAFASNALLRWLPESVLLSNRFTAGLMLLDGSFVTCVLLSSGHFGSEFFYIYFFVLFLAAIGESVKLIAAGSIVATIACLIASSGATVQEPWSLSTPTLMQIPFFLVVATFYGYLVDRVRKERNVAAHEARTAAELRSAQSLLAERATQLEHEVEVRRHAEERLKAANAELERMSEVKSEFVAMVAHELKGPLSSIRGALDIIHQGRAGALGPQQTRFVEMARRNVGQLRRIVGDLLDLSKIEAGKLQFRFEDLDLRALCEDLVLSHRPQAEERSLQLELESTEGLPAVKADGHRIQQVLTNLLTNAMKFTPAGGRVTVQLSLTGQSVEVGVLDTGTGLTAEQKERVFERFYQVPEEHADGPRGTGLGLCICRELVDAHGSELDVESERGQGSRFYFRLPVTLHATTLATSTGELAMAHT